MRSRRAAFRHAAALAIGVLLVATGASAQPAARSTDASRARDAFERGSAAYRLGDYGRAAAEYARADALDPNSAALRAALDAATLADDPVLGEELIERAERTPADAPGAKALETARARFAHRTGHLVIRCPAGVACLATIDGAAFDVTQPRIVAAGPHTVVVQSDGNAESRIVNVAADANVELAARAPATATPPAAAPIAPKPAETPKAHEAKGGGLPSVVFFVALGATVAAGGVTAWSAFDTKSRHATFENECGARPAPNCDSLQSDGQSAQTRTNVLLAVSGAFAVTTAVLGLLVQWRGPHGETVALVPSRAGAAVRVGF